MNNQIKQAFEQFDHQNILIIGDVMIDAYMWGKVERISPEAPVPVISITSHENRLGGAANVALNIQALGAKPLMCAMIGNDSQGLIFKKLLEDNQMDTNGILVSDKRKTTIKTRVISHNQHLLRIDEEVDKALSPDLEKQFIEHIDQMFAQFKFNAIIFEDYDKGNITPAIIDFVVKKSNEKQIPTLVDPKKRNFDKYKGVTLFKPNFKEICEGLKVDLPKGDFEALHRAAAQLKVTLGAKYIMVTLSELGVFITNEKSFHRFPAEVRDIADVSGAGDTVISVAACCMAAGLKPEQIAIISNIAGGLVCEKVGVVPIDKELLLEEIIRLTV
jgi:rfaE bifunctional protein kinase chain/domain